MPLRTVEDVLRRAARATIGVPVGAATAVGRQVPRVGRRVRVRTMELMDAILVVVADVFTVVRRWMVG